jgi:hypothetical protein
MLGVLGAMSGPEPPLLPPEGARSARISGATGFPARLSLSTGPHMSAKMTSLLFLFTATWEMTNTASAPTASDWTAPVEHPFVQRSEIMTKDR